MSTDSGFGDKRPETVPVTPEQGTDPVMDPGNPLSDPLVRPTTHKGWKDPSAGDGIPDDDLMPLPND
ncbi:hypothetical protein [Pseudomonas sp. 18173]|uniref:hypothetical protein n=1 Tax=Pseudomonas sp. 18173 TaxID=3390055 RepID=UPI003D22B134